MVNEGSRTVVRAAFPEPGEYVLRVNVNRKLNPLRFWDLVGSFRFRARKGTERSFPILYSPCQLEGWSILSPLSCPLAKGADVAFEILPPDPAAADVKVDVNVSRRFFPLTRGADGRFRGTVRAEGSELTVYLKKGESYTGLARYEVR